MSAGPPHWTRRARELTWPIEAAALVTLRPLLHLVGRGDQHPVLVLPGFTASDASTVPLRQLLRAQGYWVHGWGLGRNVGPTTLVVGGVRRRLEEVADRHGRAVSLIGWSLGGIYARALARQSPELVRQVITLGSPYRMREGDRSAASGTWDRLAHLHDAEFPMRRTPEEDRPKLTVPATSIYSRRDGVVRWQFCIDEVGAIAENVEVRGSHVGLGVNPAVALVILDRLAVPEGRWRPFDPGPFGRPWYPPPAAWRP